MKSLFLKIFLSYWMAQALFLALAILITLAVRERGESATWDAQQATVLSKAVQTYEQSGPAELRRYLEEVRDSLHTRAYLLDDQGKDVSGRDLPRWAESSGQRGCAAESRLLAACDSPVHFGGRCRLRPADTAIPWWHSCRPADLLARAAFPD